MGLECNIRVAGEAGQGMKTIGHVLAEMFVKAGYNVYSNMDYMSRIRGGNSYYQLRVSGKPVFAIREKTDIVIALDKESVALHEKSLNVDGIMVLDAARYGNKEMKANYLDVPLFDIAKGTGGAEIFVNAAACGVAAALTSVDHDFLEDTLKHVFKDKRSEMLESNLKTARKAYESVKPKKEICLPDINRSSEVGRYIMDGNDAIALGAIKAGCKFYSAYPMSPSTSIMSTVARYSDRYNIVVEQAEDEIAAINMVIGASFAGARSMTGTSGGGFALMGEGISLAGMTETPVVIVNAQRPAPATGLPTRTEQADLDLVIYAGHGEFARAVYAPGTAEEAYRLTIKAFETADRFQVPVIILTDQHLADSVRNIAGLNADDIKIKKHVITQADISGDPSGYKRYRITGSGISPRAVPSWIEDVMYVDSDEHTEEGHITEDADMRVKMVNKRSREKIELLMNVVEPPVTYNIAGSETVLVGFGSTYGAIREAAVRKDIGLVHLPQVWPFPSKELLSIVKGAKRVITVENNATAQLAGLIRRETPLRIDRSILKYDGRPFNVDMLMNEIKGL
ncbi:MAG: 2-oxoacid:acceptor oxidoreductase subunit alpha [Candidatus Omnitrophica bacterium]|nr:2-oxoacid:acceptor oxidoreductase subunit alpha [Candidatus Omnitrophota bacterium]